MKQVIVFAGTTEGRILAEWLAAEGVDTLCCVATEYGKELMKPEPGLEVRQGRLTAEEMKELFEKEERPLVLDVTHPYASQISAPDPSVGFKWKLCSAGFETGFGTGAGAGVRYSGGKRADSVDKSGEKQNPCGQCGGSGRMAFRYGRTGSGHHRQ